MRGLGGGGLEEGRPAWAEPRQSRVLKREEEESEKGGWME